MKETILDLQINSIRDNLVFSGIPEQAGEDPEVTVRQLMQEHLQLPIDTIKSISFTGFSNWLGKRPIVAKFEHFKQKDLVKSREPVGISNDPFP